MFGSLPPTALWFDWQDWGRLDFEEVFEEVMKEYPIDPDRVYLAGSLWEASGTLARVILQVLRH